MSSAEKLKALEPWLAKGSSREVIALVEALPQIVAVVEAQERWFADIDGPEGMADDGEIRAALTALDEALT